MVEENKEKITKENSWEGTKFDGVREKIETNLENRKTMRDRSFKFFGRNQKDNVDRNLVQYINDSDERFNGYKVKDAWKEEWQANYFDPLTHDKTIAILARLAIQPRKVEFSPLKDNFILSRLRAKIFEDFNDYNEDVLNNRSQDCFMRLLEVVTKGTVIIFEDYGNWEIKVNNFSEIDHLTGKSKHIEEKLMEGGLTSHIVSLEEFYPDSVWEFDMKKQMGATWVQKMPVGEFKTKFAKWDNFQMVIDNRMGNISQENGTDFNEIGQTDDFVEIIRDFDVIENEYLIMADRIPLTKKKNPMRWKGLPFAKGVLEPLSSKFFYGKALAHKLEANQDGINALYNMLLDGIFISMFSPIVISGVADPVDDTMYPNKVIEIPDANASITELRRTPPSPIAFQALKYMHNAADLSSVDEVAQGNISQTTAKTATEVTEASKSGREIMTLLVIFVDWMERGRAEVRIPNLMNYYTRPKEIRKIMGDGGEKIYNMAFHSLFLEKAKLSTGEFGAKQINIVPTSNELRSSEELKIINSAMEGESEIIDITPEQMRDFQMTTKMVEAPALNISSEQQKRYDMAFAQTAFAQPEIFEIGIVAKKFAKAMNQGEEVIKKQQEQNVPPEIQKLLAGRGGGQGAGAQQSAPMLPTAQTI